MKLLSIFLIGLMVFSCGHVDRVDNAKIRAEIKYRQVKQIPSAKFNQIAQVWGEGISKAFLKTLDDNKYTNINQLATDKKVDSLTRYYDLKWSVNTGTTQPKNQKLMRLHEAYVYNAEQQLPPSDNVQQIQNDSIVYTVQLPYSHSFTQNVAKADPNKLAYFELIFNKKAISRLVSPKELKKF
jgi:hypothetical protein